VELRQLRHFIAAVENGKLSSAVNQTLLSQPGLSRSIKNLEIEVGVKLLERKAQGVVPTEAGHQFYLEAKFILNECNRAVENVGALAKGVGSRVVIAVAPMFMSNIAARAAANVSKDAPMIDLAIVEANQQGSIPDLVEGRVDAILTILAQQSLPKQIASEHLCTVRAVLAAGSKNPISKKKRLKPDDFIDVKWAKMSSTLNSQDVIDQFMISNDLPVPRRAIQTNSIAFVKALITDYGYISMLPSHMLEPELANGEIKALPTRTGSFRRAAGLLYRVDGGHRAGVGIVMDGFRMACRDFAKSHNR
jgi:DNA-binding transcriptional LysR family regulator